MTQDRELKVLNIVNFPEIHGSPVNMEREHPYYIILLRAIATLLLPQVASLDTVWFGSSQIGGRAEWQCVDAIVPFERDPRLPRDGTFQRAVEVRWPASLTRFRDHILRQNPRHKFNVHDWLYLETTVAELGEFYDDGPQKE